MRPNSQFLLLGIKRRQTSEPDLLLRKLNTDEEPAGHPNKTNQRLSHVRSQATRDDGKLQTHFIMTNVQDQIYKKWQQS